MSQIELQILKIEGLEPGTICKVLLDNEEILVKNSQFSIPRTGIVHLKFFKGRSDLGGVLFSSELLSQVAYSYVPIYTPAVFIDVFPTDIDPPRVLLIQTASSLETSMLSSKCETICYEESLESMKLKDDSIEKSFSLKTEPECSQKVESKNSQIENILSQNSAIKTVERKNEVNDDGFSVLLEIIKDLERQRDLLLENKRSVGNESSSALVNKVMQDSLHISKLVKEKNSLLLKVRALEKENRALKTKSLQQDLMIKEVVSRENLVKKELESKKFIESLSIPN